MNLLLAALFAAIGGLILNLMPCVFPVIGLKVLGFARHARSHRRETTHGALAFAAGVLVSFWVLAALLLALRAAGEAAGWGFQLQSPPFVALMALLFVLIGLNFAGVFEVGAGMTRLGGVDPLASGQGSLARAFGSGASRSSTSRGCATPPARPAARTGSLARGRSRSTRRRASEPTATCGCVTSRSSTSRACATRLARPAARTGP